MNRGDAGERTPDGADDLRVLLVTTGGLLAVFALGSAVQSVFVFRPERMGVAQLLADSPMLGTRLVLNLLTVGFVLAVCAATRIAHRRPWVIVAIGAPTAIAAGVGRHALQLATGVYPQPVVQAGSVEVLTVAAAVVVSLGVGLAHVRTRARLRERMRAEAEHRLRASTALADLATAEMRVRREVADGLHTTLQGQLVLIEARIASLAARVHEHGVDAAVRRQLDELRVDLGEIRERDVRELSHLLYPVGVDVSLGHALRVLIRRIPAEIDVAAEVDADVERLLDVGDAAVSRRIDLVRGAEEGITNALRHGAASTVRIAVSADAGPARVRLVVEDDGVGPPPDPEWNGLARIAERFHLDGGSVSLGESSLGGARLEVEVPA